MRKLMGFASAGLMVCHTGVASAADTKTLANDEMACTSMQDWTDILSLERQNGTAAAALADKVSAGECTRWLAGVQVHVEQRGTGKLANGDDVRLACAKLANRDDTKCSWVIDDAALGRPR